MKILKFAAYLFFLLSLSFANASQTENVDQNDYKVLSGDSFGQNFEIIYNAKHQELAEVFFRKIKKSLSFFKTFITERPAMVTVVIKDSTDSTNGYATPLPYPHIVLYPVMPTASDSLAEFGDWPLELFTHEYTHILTFEPTRGFMSVLKTIFGTIVAPNLLLPSWWKEGVAVEMETRIGDHGRLRSKWQDAYFRALALNDKIYDKSIDRINESPLQWPYGQHPYVFGSVFFSKAVSDKGVSFVDEILQAQGGRVPYFIEEPAQRLLGRDYASYYDSALLELQKNAEKQNEILKQKELTVATELDQKLLFSKNPSFSADGQSLLITGFTVDERNQLYIYQKNDTSWKVLADQKNPHGPIDLALFFKTKNHVLFSKVDFFDNERTFSDLYVWIPETQKTQQITFGERAREGSLGLDDQQITYVQVGDGKTQLKVADLAFDSEKNKPYAVSNQKVLWQSGPFERIANPSFISADEIIFSYRNNAGIEEIKKINVQTLALETYVPGHSEARLPIFRNQTSFFTSSKNGTFNVYRLAPAPAPEIVKSSKKKTPAAIASPTTEILTNTQSAYLNYDVNPATEEMAITQITGEGLRVSLIAAADWTQKNRQVEKIQPLMASHYTVAQNSEAAAPLLLTPTSSADPMAIANTNQMNFEKIPSSEDYSVWPYLIPRYWMPFISTSQNGLYFQVETSAFDPMHLHSYTALVNYDSYLEKTGYLFTYTNDTLPWAWSLTGQRASQLYGSRDFISTTDLYSISTTPDLMFLPLPSALYTAVGFRFGKEELNGSSIQKAGPFIAGVYKDFTQGPTQISPQRGYSVAFLAEHYARSFGDLSYTRAAIAGLKFFKSPFTDSHSFMFKLNAIRIFEEVSHFYGTSSQSVFLSQDNPAPTFVLRGYDSGQFFGRSMVSANAEYRFPIRNIYNGQGTTPIFFKKLSGAAIVDALTVDGFGLNKDRSGFIRSSTNKVFYNLGAEVRLETTIGYLLPVTFIAGVYAGQDPKYVQNGTFNLSLMLGTSN